jgi:phosphate transport system permease protein
LFVLLLLILVAEARAAILAYGPRFLWTIDWNPQVKAGETFPSLGALLFVYGTVATSIIAMAIAVPLGVATAACLSEIATGWVRRVGAFLIELLAAIPSVVYGFWGKYFLALAVEKVFGIEGGVGILSAGIILAIMIVPYITAITFDVCQAVPRTQREGALAVGATRWQMIWTVILPYARPGIIGGCFLALGRNHGGRHAHW